MYSAGSFGKDWLNDIVTDLKLQDVNIYEADYGLLPICPCSDARE